MSTPNHLLLPRIEHQILVIRGQKVMVDADLAALYGVPTKALNQAVKRNATRFPADFLFQLTDAEKLEVVTNCDHLAKLEEKTASIDMRHDNFSQTTRAQLKQVFDAPKALTTQPEPVKRPIGFVELEDKSKMEKNTPVAGVFIA